MQKSSNKWSASISTVVYFLLEIEIKCGKVIAVLYKVELCFSADLQSMKLFSRTR